MGNNGTGATIIELGGANDTIDLGGAVATEGIKFMNNSTSSVTLGRTAGADTGIAAAITTIGAGALSRSPATSSGHTAIGYLAGANISGTSHQNTMIGRGAAGTGSFTYSFSTGVGSQVLKNNAATNNSALGCGVQLVETIPH